MKTIVNRFDQAAPTYDEHSSVQRKVAARLARMLPAYGTPSKIFEVGCGTGHLTKNLLTEFPDAEIVASDASPAMLELAAQKVVGQKLKFEPWFVGEDFQGIPERTDWVVSSMAFQWLGNWQNLALQLALQCDLVAFALPIEGTFDNWIAAHRELGVHDGARQFCSNSEIETWLGDLSDIRGEVSYHDYFLEFEKPLQFVKSLRQIGADHPEERHVPVNLRKVFALFPDGINIRYSIAFVCLQSKV